MLPDMPISHRYTPDWGKIAVTRPSALLYCFA
jgi:hypothetical protein